MTDPEIRTAEDARSISEAVEYVFDSFYSEGPIDWQDFIDRVETAGYDLGSDMLSPAVKEIKKMVGEMRRERG